MMKVENLKTSLVTLRSGNMQLIDSRLLNMYYYILHMYDCIMWSIWVDEVFPLHE